MSRIPPALVLAATAVVACSGPITAPASAPPSDAPTNEPTAPASTPVAVATPTAAPTAAAPLTFQSLLYGYSATLPPGWLSAPAMLRWDGASAPGHDDGSVDKLIGLPVGTEWVSVFAYAAPVNVDLDRFIQDNIAWIVRDHGDTCPATRPEKIEAIEIGGVTGKVLLWDCGILIDMAVAIRDHTGFVFVMRDPGVHAATDPTDRATFDQLLESVTFPN